MDTTYRLSQTGKEVQALLDQVTPNEQSIAQETTDREQAITQEQQRAETAEQQLQRNIDAEQQARIDAVSAEQQARIADVDAEEQRAKTAEQQLQENIDAIGQTGSSAVTAERERAQAVEQTLQQNINTETQARIADVDTEEQRAKTAEQQNATAISSETTRAGAAEQTLQQNIDAEQLRAEGAEATLQQNIDAEKGRAQQAEQLLDGKIAQEQQRAEGVEGDLQADIDDINGKIPAAASPQNQLADKQFVNSSIQTATADFKGTFNSKGELDQVTANANDYAFVKTTDPEGNTVYSRYKWVDGQGWLFEYTLNNSSFTAAQWAAIQSGITAVLVQKLGALPTYQALMQLIGTKQDALTFDTQPTMNSKNPVQSGGIFEALGHKQDALTFDETPTQYSRNPVISGALYNIFNAIQSLFPSAASLQNKLTDKQYVDSKVAGAAPNFDGIFTSIEQLEALTGMSVNDFAFVTTTDEDGNTIYTRYHYDSNAWQMDFSFASNSFTEAQWMAINSGITALLVQKLTGLPTSQALMEMFAAKQNVLTFDSTPTQGSQNPVTSEGIANAILAAAGVQFVDVQTLPKAGADTMGKVYLTPSAQQGQNASDWWVTIYDVQHDPVYYWKQVNTTSVDLSDYYKKEEVDDKVTRLQTQIGERNVTVEAQDAPSADTLTYTNALGETANHIVGDKRIVPNADSVTGYDVYELLHLANGVATWGIGGGSTDIRQKLWVNLLSNQSGDTDLNGVTVKVEADNETILDTTWAGETLFCRISPLKQVKVTVGSKAGYYLASNVQTFESSIAGERTINFSYETCVVKFQPTSNQGAGDSTIEGATGTINGVSVNYGDTLKVAMGQQITVHCDAIENYVTPADYTGTASTAQLTPALVYQTTLVTVSWESNLGTDPAIDAVQATVAGRTVSSGQTIKVATGSEVAVVFPNVEGYHTPSIATFTAEGTTVVKPTVQYSTDIYTVGVDSNQPDKTDIENVAVVVSYVYAGQSVSKELADGDTIKVPTGTAPTATATDISGYRKTISVTAATLTIGVQYDTTLVSVNATSNQSTQQVIDPVLTGLVFGINGTEVTAGQQVKVPTGSALTITSPDIAHYAKTVTAAQTAEGSSYIVTVTYTTTLVTLNMVSNVAGVETSAPTGAAGTVSYDGGASQTIHNGEYAKVPTGMAFTVTYANIQNYGTPTGYSGTAAGNSMSATKAEYVQGVVVVNISMSDSDAQALALAGAFVAIDGGTPIAYEGRPIPVAPLSQVVVSFKDVEGYATPGNQTFIMPTGTKTVSASYDTTIFTVFVTSNHQGDETIAAQKVSVSYMGLATPKQVGNNGTVKVPTGLTLTATAPDVTGYAKEVNVLAASRIITAGYQTTIVSVNMVGENGGVEGAAPQGAQATVSYQGGTDQVLTDNTQTANVPTGTEFTVTYGPVNSYATPAAYTATASGTSMTAPKAVYIYGVVQLTVSMSDGDSQALTLVAPTISINSGAYRAMTGTGGVFTANLNTGDTYNIRFNSLVGDGYQTPADISGTKGSGVESVTAQYQTTIYTVAVTSSLPDDPTIAQQIVSVTYDGLSTAKQVGNGGTVKVPANLVPTATAPDVQGYGKRVSVDSVNRTITAAYVYGVLNIEVSMSDNDNTALADVTAIIAVNGGEATAMQGTVDTSTHKKTFAASLNVGDTYVVSFGTEEGYATPADISGTKASGVETATAEYETDIYTLTVTGQSRQETIEYQQDGQTVSKTLSSGNAVKVPAGTVPTVASAYVKGYARTVTIGTVTAHAATITVAYETTAITIGIRSNQADDATIAALRATVSWTYDGHSESETVADGDSVNVPTGTTPTVTFAEAPDGYSRAVSGYTATYSTTLVSVNMVGETSGTEGAAPQGAQATVSYQGGTDQVLTDNTQTAKVPTGTAFTITYANVSGYATPATYSATATGASMTAPKATYIYGVLQLTVSMSDSDATALADVQPMIAINGGAATAMTGSAGIFTANMEVDDTYTITFNSLVAVGYQTPAAISGTFQGGVQTETAQYLTTILTLGSIVTTKDGNVQGQNPQGAGVTVAYTGQTAPATLTAINDSVKVPANLTPTITPLAVQYYAASAALTGGSISVTYTTVSRTVSITSNQAIDSVIAAVAATLTYTYEGETVTRTDIYDGTEVLIPATATAIAFTAPDVTGYAKTISGAAISYATTILTVTLASDTGEADLSGVTKTVTDTTISTTVTPQQDGTYKIPTGHGYSVSVSDDVDGYKAPDAATGTAAGTTATVTMTYEEQAGFVDLGLPSGLKWAQGNLVKDSQGNYSIGKKTDWGTYVSWGNIIGHNEGDGYDFSDANYNSTPGHSVAANIPSNDAAHDIALATLGTPWHLPTKENFQELYDNTDSEWVADYNGTGVAGRKFMKKSDHSVYVFFPASGRYNGTTLDIRGTDGYYWSASFRDSTEAYNLYFSSSIVSHQNRRSRYRGLTVRPVQ